MQNEFEHVYRPRRMSTRLNKYQQPVIQQPSPGSVPFRIPSPRDYYLDYSHHGYLPQVNHVAPVQVPSYQTPPPSTYGYAQPLPAGNRYNLRRHAPQYQQVPTPPVTPPPCSVEGQYFDIRQRLQFVRMIGSGAYGVVHLATDVLTGKQYAVKVLNKFNAQGLPLDQRQRQFQQTEMRLHYEVSDHANIVSLLRIVEEEDRTHVVMDYCPEGDLFMNITERGRFVGNDVAARNIFLQILDAVAHCHRRGIYHRDLKPENILVCEDGNQVKLADFGLATTDSYSSDFGCGSTFYMSPECQDQTSGMGYYACGPNDIWSLGVILVNLTCGRNPWKSASLKDSTFRAYMNDRQFLKTILPLSDELNEILGMIFEIDPARRITLDELRQRIIHCPVFTQQPECTAPALDVIDEDFVDEDLEVFSPGSLSPASSLSDEGSMVSDDSDDSSVPSEADVAADVDVTFDVMDEHSTYDEMGPMDASKDFEPTSPYVHVVDPFAFTGVNEVVCTHPTLPTGHIPSGNVNYQEPSHHPLPLQSYPVSRPVIAKPAKSVHQFQFLGRLTPSSLNPFCPQPGNQRLPAIWRSF